MELRTVIVGTQFRPIEAQKVYNALDAGDEITLEREPDNQYDSNAVAVYAFGVHIGYIPRTMNSELAAALDAGREFTCEYDPEIARLFIKEVELVDEPE